MALRPAGRKDSSRLGVISVFDGAKLRRLRDEHKFTAQQLADRCGISRGYVNQIESGARQPSIAVVTRLSDALGISTFVMPEQDLSKNSMLVSDVNEEKELIRHQSEEACIPKAATAVDFIPLPALLGFSIGCVEDQNMALLYGEDARTEVRLSGVTQQWGSRGLHKFTLISSASVVELHIETKDYDCGNTPCALYSDERNRPDVELELGENGCIKQLTLVWFTSYSSLAERLEFLRKHESQFQLKVWESQLDNAWSQAKTLSKMTRPH